MTLKCIPAIVVFTAWSILFVFEFTSFHTTENTIHLTVYLVAFLMGPWILLWYGFLSKRRKRVGVAWLLLLMGGGLLMYTVVNFNMLAFKARSSWQTVSLEYQHKDQKNRFIALQMRDVGALGYRGRRVDTLKISEFLSYSVLVEEEKIDSAWTKVSVHLNPFGWK